MMGWYDGYGHMDNDAWLSMGIMMTLIGLLLIVAIGLMIRWATGGSKEETRRQPDPMAILDERFARGEMDTDDYETRRTALRSSR